MDPDDTAAGPSSRPDQAAAARPPPTTLQGFWSAAEAEAAPTIASIRSRLPSFSSPPLRVQRVSQLDAELLDSELISMLLEPVSSALSLVRSSLPLQIQPELLLALRLALYKFSIYDRGATYGAMLQNLRYRNERAHRGGLQSTSRDAPLSRSQLALYPTLTILAPYLHTRLERHMAGLSYSQMGPNDPRRLAWALLDQLRRFHAGASLLNFVAFLGDGKYRTLTDRALGMRLTYSERTMNRNVSFEFLNRQLVWHAFTEFLLFLLPLLKPRRLARKLLRLPTHPWILSFWLYVLPRFVSQRLGLYRDAAGRPRLKLANMLAAASKRDKGSAKGKGQYHELPEDVCAICWERIERAAGVKSTGAPAVSSDTKGSSASPTNSASAAQRKALREGIPRSDPLDPSRGVLAGAQKKAKRGAPTPIPSPRPAANETSSSSTLPSVSAHGLPYADALVHSAYAAKPCGCVYCYYCLAGALLSEEAAEELADGAGYASEEGRPAAWHCLRCGEGVIAAERDAEEEEGNEEEDQSDDEIELEEVPDEVDEEGVLDFGR